jgi:hypothetical protein
MKTLGGAAVVALALAATGCGSKPEATAAFGPAMVGVQAAAEGFHVSTHAAVKGTSLWGATLSGLDIGLGAVHLGVPL